MLYLGLLRRFTRRFVLSVAKIVQVSFDPHLLELVVPSELDKIENEKHKLIDELETRRRKYYSRHPDDNKIKWKDTYTEEKKFKQSIKQFF